MRGAGIGPATTFLFAGPAINVAAIFLTAGVLGWEMSLMRLAFTILFAVVIGIIMGINFRKEEMERIEAPDFAEESPYSNAFVGIFLGLMLAVMILLNLKKEVGVAVRWSVSGALLVPILILTFVRIRREEQRSWVGETWFFTKRILPYLFLGVAIAGLIREFLPQSVVDFGLAANKLASCFVASIFGAIMYFATLTEVPIIRELAAKGMGKGPALALFMSGYTLSLPNILVLIRIIGWRKTLVYVGLVVVFSTIAGYLYGYFIPDIGLTEGIFCAR
jgi:uncharacterized membrane protein YraQ (UPF0718 family)